MKNGSNHKRSEGDNPLQVVVVVSSTLQVVFSPGSVENPQGSSQHYKVFLKAEEAKKNKSDVWTVSAAETSKKESKGLLVCFS